MKTSQEVVEYIEMRYGYFLETPKAYFLTPAAMEATLIELELLYEFLVDDRWTAPFCFDFGYNNFLLEQGFGVGQFSSKKTQDESGLIAMAAFWKQYLESKHRKH